jgi:hypothetical protein
MKAFTLPGAATAVDFSPLLEGAGALPLREQPHSAMAKTLQAASNDLLNIFIGSNPPLRLDSVSFRLMIPKLKERLSTT